MCFKFSKFFCYFFQNFFARVGYERNSGLKLFSLFLGQSQPVLAKNNTRKRFLIFWFFLLFFSEFACPSRVWKEFETKNFLSFSRPISFWLEIMPERGFFNFFNFFFNFFRNFLAQVECERNLGLKFFFSLSRPILSRFHEK